MAARKAAAKKRKTTTKRVATRRVAAKKKVTTKKKAPARKLTAVKTPFTKTQILNTISEATELSKKEVGAVLEALADVMERHIKKGAAGVFSLPGLLKVEVRKKPATKARKGINPFTGEEMMFKAKPARNIVKVRALKKLKEMVS